ncbi:hypothetical protein CF319_g2982 [Tilletia indica]|nr:hypothetical protein CF319_g2982 [Tilletia indica]
MAATRCHTFVRKASDAFLPIVGTNYAGRGAATRTSMTSHFTALSRYSTGQDRNKDEHLPVVTIFTGPQCSLCDEMKLELKSVQEKHPFHLKTYNIHDRSLPDQPTWQKKYIFDIPVLHVDGVEVLRHRVTEGGRGRLVQALLREGGMREGEK